MDGTDETRHSPPRAALPRVRPVPARAEDLVRVLRAGDLTFSESLHRDPLGVHVHERATVTLLLEGTFEERYPGRLRSRSCVASSVLYRPPQEPHADRFGRDGAHNLVIEVAHARLEPLVLTLAALAGVVERRDATVHLIAHKMHLEL